MSTADYEKTLRLGKKLTAKFGRSISLVQLDPGPANSAQPWKGNTTPRGEVLDSLTVNGVFVEPESLERLGKQAKTNEFIKSSEQVVIVVSEFSLEKFNEIIDSLDESRYTIDNIQQLNPGDKMILHYVRAFRRGRTTAVRGALL